MKKAGLFIALLLIAFLTLHAQEDTAGRDNSLVPLPLLFYTPETSLGFGGAIVYNFKFKDEPASSTVSQLQVGFAYTLENQILFYTPYRIYFNNDKYLSYGELGFYKYFYRFYGIGNDIDVDEFSIFEITYPRIRLNFLKEVASNFHIGARYWFDGYNNVDFDSDTNNIADPSITGIDGGIISGIGLVTNYDTRDNIFFPSEGLFIETVLLQNGEFLGSDFNYFNYSIDASKYFNVIKDHVIAVNAYGNFYNGDPPFFQMAFIGGTKKMRGYYEGTYRDKKLMMLQTEYRMPIFWRFGLVAFGGAGVVAPTFKDFDFKNTRFTYGAGMRFRLNEDKVNLRFDAAFSPETSGFYLTVGEAF